VLSRLGLDEKIIAQGARLDGIHGETTRGRTIIDTRYEDINAHFFGVGIHRGTLFNILLEKARALDVDFVTNCSLRSAALEGGRRRLRDAHGQDRGDFDLVIDASGYKSLLRDYGVKTRSKPYLYGALFGVCEAVTGESNILQQRFKGTQTMVGALPIGKKPGSDKEWKDAGLDAWKEEVMAVAPEMKPYLDQFTSQDQLLFAPYADVAMEDYYAERLAFIGDAAHSTSPLLGQSASMGFIDAFTLSEKLKARPGLRRALASYSAERKRHVRFQQRASRTLTPFFQSENAARPRELLRDTGAPVLMRIPFVRRQAALTVAGVKKGVFSEINPRRWGRNYSLK
jgi:2-polyprenyl-6-methoxyphenol hydroxylase-like FAD-dependent oxidoreductase